VCEYESANTSPTREMEKGRCKGQHTQHACEPGREKTASGRTGRMLHIFTTCPLPHTTPTVLLLDAKLRHILITTYRAHHHQPSTEGTQATSAHTLIETMVRSPILFRNVSRFRVAWAFTLTGLSFFKLSPPRIRTYSTGSSGWLKLPLLARCLAAVGLVAVSTP
jgi:hypothetical protein